MSYDDDVRNLLSEARIHFEAEQFQESINLCQQAYRLNACPKIWRKIEKISAFLPSENKENRPTPSYAPMSNSTNPVSHLTGKAPDAFDLGNVSEALNLTCVSHKTGEKLSGAEEASAPTQSSFPIRREKDEAAAVSPVQIDTEALLQQARTLFNNGCLKRCLELLKQVQSVTPSEKIQRKIDRISAQLNAGQCTEATDVMTVIDGFSLPTRLFEKLYPYQQDGVRWLWNLHKSGPGGVLADDMGLGKTVQVIAFLAGLSVSTDKPFTALIVMPVSVLITWETELKRWAPTLRVFVFHDVCRSTRLHHLSNIQRRGGLMLTTYGLVASSCTELARDINADPQYLCANSDDCRMGKEFIWDYLILDEAHKIKNPSAKSTKAILSIPSKHKILLTGTAIQNNLSELWSLYNCTHSGRLLGRIQTFKTEFEKPITRAREKDASRADRMHGLLMAESLRKIIAPYFLRRTKAEILPATDHISQSTDPNERTMKSLPKKTDVVVWTYLSQIQERSYRNFLELKDVKELVLGTNRRSPLVELVILKKLCDHPRLLSSDQCASLQLTVGADPDKAYSKDSLPTATQLMDESGKLMFLGALLQSFLDEPNVPRALIFSQSLRFLDMAEKVALSLQKSGDCSIKHRVLRLDGRLKVQERQNVIEQFEREHSYTVMLLTTQVGGVGLTLTAANRVIILDPSWNPAVDAQAVDRAYRIGQKSDVVIYRLITCATVEEKIYRRQIFKDSVIRQTTSTGQNKTDSDPYRYFTREDLRELFSLGNARVSVTQQQLAALHEDRKKWEDDSICSHLSYLINRDTVFGLSFHDLMFSRIESQPKYEESTAVEKQLIYNRQKAAEYAIARECGSSHDSVPKQRIEIPTEVFRPTDVQFKRPMFNKPFLGAEKMHQPFVPPRPVKNTGDVIVLDDSEDSVDSMQSDSSSLVYEQTELNSPTTLSSSTDDEEKLLTSLREMSIVSSVTHQNTPDSANSNSSSHPKSFDVSMMATVPRSTPISSNLFERHLLKTPQSDNRKSHPRSIINDNSSRIHPDTRIEKSADAHSEFPCRPQSPSLSPQVDRAPSEVNEAVHAAICEEPTDVSSQNSHDNPTDFKIPNDPRSFIESMTDSSNTDQFQHEDVIQMDITVPIDDDELARTVNMESIHEVLSKSGLYTKQYNSSLVLIEDSYENNHDVQSTAPSMSLVNATNEAEDSEIIPDSYEDDVYI